MKKTMILFFMTVMIGGSGCSLQSTADPSDLKVVFDNEPVIFDASVYFMGTVVGRMLSREWANGVTWVSVELDDQYADLRKTNLAAVVNNGQLRLTTLCGYGDPLPTDATILGFRNPISYQWFKFRHLINNITVAADRRVQHMRIRSGLAG
jgi:hypothetical protein